MVAVVLFALVEHRAVAEASHLANRGNTVPAYLGVVMTAVLGGLHAYGAWVIDYAKAAGAGPDEMRGRVRKLVGVGAVAVLSVLAHVGWAGAGTAGRGETVPGVFGSVVMQCMASLVQYGAWTLRCVRGDIGAEPHGNP